MIKKRTPRDYKFIRLLGEGSFSSVYLAVDADANPLCKQQSQQLNSASQRQQPMTTTANDNDPPDDGAALEGQRKTAARIKLRKYAIKICQKSHIKRQGKQVAIMREKEIMNILNQCPNEHFIRLYCTFQDMERLFFVMSYAENGELLTYMLRHPLSLDAVRRFTLQLVAALEHLHKLNIVHRDLKPENILLGEHLNLLISDFGSAQIYNRQPTSQVQQPNSPSQQQHHSSNQHQGTPSTGDTVNNNNTTTTTTTSIDHNNASHDATTTTNNNTGDRRSSFVGTAQYVSPEMLSDRRASNKSDLWALGVIIYQMITNVMPFDAPNEYLIYKKIQSLDYTFPDDFHPDARDLITSLVQLEPLDRLGAYDELQTDGYKSVRMHQFLIDVTDSNPLAELELTNGITGEDPDLRNLERIAPGLDETQLLRLLTDG